MRSWLPHEHNQKSVHNKSKRWILDGLSDTYYNFPELVASHKCTGHGIEEKEA